MNASQALARAAAAATEADLHQAVAQLVIALRDERRARDREVKALLSRVRNLEYALYQTTGVRAR